jgi:hypothetical protein
MSVFSSLMTPIGGSGGDGHPPLTLGTPNGLSLDAPNQVLSLIPSGLDHGALGGLADNDHPQYPLRAQALTMASLRG